MSFTPKCIENPFCFSIFGMPKTIVKIVNGEEKMSSVGFFCLNTWLPPLALYNTWVHFVEDSHSVVHLDLLSVDFFMNIF